MIPSLLVWWAAAVALELAASALSLRSYTRFAAAARGADSFCLPRGAQSSALDDLLAGTTGDLVAVSHFGAILTAIQRAAGLTPLQAFAQKIDNLSLTEIAIDAEGWRLVRANHLA